MASLFGMADRVTSGLPSFADVRFYSGYSKQAADFHAGNMTFACCPEDIWAPKVYEAINWARLDILTRVEETRREELIQFIDRAFQNRKRR